MAPDAAERVGAGGLGAQAPLIDRIRAFFGLPLPEAQREVLGGLLGRWAVDVPQFRWTPVENLHLTVRFIGAVEREVAEGVATRLAGAPGPEFELALDGLDTFRRGGLARVVWMGVAAGAEPLRALAARVEAECRQAGLEPEARPFKAHLTLARARAHAGALLPDLGVLPSLEPWRAAELVLYASHVGKGGAVHEPIRRIRLRD